MKLVNFIVYLLTCFPAGAATKTPEAWSGPVIDIFDASDDNGCEKSYPKNACLLSGNPDKEEAGCIPKSDKRACVPGTWSAVSVFDTYNAAADETIITYKVAQILKKPGVSHVTAGWTGNCCVKRVESSNAGSRIEPGRDPTTCSFGVKFDSGFSSGSRTYTIVYAGQIQLEEGKGSITVKGGPGFCEIPVKGPDCSLCSPELESASPSLGPSDFSSDSPSLRPTKVESAAPSISPSDFPSDSPSRATQVSGQVLEDTNNDDVGEEPISGVPVNLCKKSNDSDCVETSTDSNGEFSFTDVEPDEYCVVQTNIEKYIDVGDSIVINGGNELEEDGLDDPNKVCIVVFAGVDVTDIIFVDELVSSAPSDAPSASPSEAGSISGIVFSDNDCNSIFSAGDVGKNGVQVVLNRGSSVIRQVSTSNGGVYSFNGLPGGSYSIELSTSISPNTITVTLVAGGESSDNNFLMAETCSGRKLLRENKHF